MLQKATHSTLEHVICSQRSIHVQTTSYACTLVNQLSLHCSVDEAVTYLAAGFWLCIAVAIGFAID